MVVAKTEMPIPSGSEGYLSINPEQFPEHSNFNSAAIALINRLSSVGIPAENTMIISGGSVALRQMGLGINDRVPTDLDVIIGYPNQTPEQAEEILEGVAHALKLTNQFSGTQIIRDHRSHWQYLFTNSLLETSYTNNGSIRFPVDIMTAMTTVFPQNCSHLPALTGATYHFPISEIVTQFGQPLKLGEQTVRIAPPAFALFYKLTMNRNGEHTAHPGCPKQDDDDLRRMLEMGLIDPNNPEFQEVLKILTISDNELLNQFLQLLNYKIACLEKHS